MNAIIGLTRLAEEEEDAKKVHSYLHSIETSSNFLLGLINDILDMSKIENGALTLKEDVYHVEECVEGINTIIRPLMEEKNIRFTVAMNCHVECIRTDRLRFNQIFFNLLSNASFFPHSTLYISRTPSGVCNFFFICPPGSNIFLPAL